MSAKAPSFALAAELNGSDGPINVLTFSRDGKFLISGGDDERVRVWDIANSRLLQTLQHPNSRWGQVTCIVWTFVAPEAASEEKDWLCVGTGRGTVTMLAAARNPCKLDKQYSYTSSIFPADDAVESIAYDGMNDRLAAGSHAGYIKMYSIKERSSLKPLWNIKLASIPRGITFFGEANESLLINGLLSGSMISCCADDARVDWKKQLAGGIGDAILSKDSSTLLVNNLTNCTFELYHFAKETPFKSFSTPSKRKKIMQCVFSGENDKFVICGSDHGKVYAFAIDENDKMQVLGQDKDNVPVQSLACSKTADYHLLASGSSSPTGKICVWKQPIQSELQQSSDIPAVPVGRRQNNGPDRQMILLIFICIWVTYPAWGGWFLLVREGRFPMFGNNAAGQSSVQQPNIAAVVNAHTVTKVVVRYETQPTIAAANPDESEISLKTLTVSTDISDALTVEEDPGQALATVI